MVDEGHVPQLDGNTFRPALMFLPAVARRVSCPFWLFTGTMSVPLEKAAPLFYGRPDTTHWKVKRFSTARQHIHIVKVQLKARFVESRVFEEVSNFVNERTTGDKMMVFCPTKRQAFERAQKYSAEKNIPSGKGLRDIFFFVFFCIDYHLDRIDFKR